MKRTILTVATLLAAAGVANAQTTTPSSPSATTPPSSGSATTPGSGAASGGAMTQTSVKSKLEASGYSNVTNIKQDLAGNWTAKATKGGQQVAVSIDSTGMVKEAQQ